MAQAWFLQARLAKRRPELSIAHLGGVLGKILVASALMGGAVWAGWSGWARIGLSGTAADIAGVAVMIAAGVGVYAALLWMLRVEEREEIAELVRRKLARKKA